MFYWSFEVIAKVDDKFSYSSATCGVNFTFTTIGEQLFHMAETMPDKVMFIFHKNGGLRLTYGSLKEQAVRLAQNFMAIGLKQGDRIAQLLPNSPELLISCFASALIGLIVVPLDSEFDAVELEFMIKKTEPAAALVLYSDEFKPTADELFPNLRSFQKGEYDSEKFTNLKHLIYINAQSQSGINSQNVWSYDELANNSLNQNQKEFPIINPEDTFLIMFTVNIIYINLCNFIAFNHHEYFCFVFYFKCQNLSRVRLADPKVCLLYFRKQKSCYNIFVAI